LNELCVILEKRTNEDTIAIDFSTLRVKDDTAMISVILEKVLKRKYPDLHWVVKDVNMRTAATVTDGYFRSAINWEAVKTKPIWAVDERVITVACARDVAKSLAVDVLKESLCFDYFDDETIDAGTSQQPNPNEVAIIDSTSACGEIIDDDSVDWDDI
jgi:hypothetical protein